MFYFYMFQIIIDIEWKPIKRAIRETKAIDYIYAEKANFIFFELPCCLLYPFSSVLISSRLCTYIRIYRPSQIILIDGSRVNSFFILFAVALADYIRQ